MYITHDYYKANGGVIPLEAFAKYERQARATIDYYTFNRVETPVPEKVKECMLELIDFQEAVEKAAEEGSKVVKSETVGNHTVTYADGVGLLGIQTGANTGKSKAGLEYDIVAKYLMNTGLMYRGVE